jgi:ethanolamine-phosphate cytidylyltransferase
LSKQERRELTKQFSSGERRVSLEELENGDGGSVAGSPRPPAHTIISRFMPTSRRIVQFSDGVPAPPGARIVYIDGGFDLFHPGHVEILKVCPVPFFLLLVALSAYVSCT